MSNLLKNVKFKKNISWFFPYQKQIETNYNRLNFWDQYWTLPLKRNKEGPKFIWNNWYVASLQKIKQIFPTLAGNICTSSCVDPHLLLGPLRSDHVTISVPKRKLIEKYQNDRPQWQLVIYLSNLCKRYLIDRSLHTELQNITDMTDIFAEWGKKVDRKCIFAKPSLFWKDLRTYHVRFLSIIKSNLIELLTFVLQNYHFVIVIVS